jgi:TolB-like protein/tetratricopeptide (TPR) repeat protein
MSREAPESGGSQRPTEPPAPLHVFISYASQDAAVATALVEALERHGIACWIAPRDIKAGALYADAIVRAIGSAKTFVLVLSESAIASSHVSKETERASSKKRPIIALRIDAAPLTPALEYFLSESQWIEAQVGKMESAFAKLIGAIPDSVQTAPGIIPAVTPGSSASTASGTHPKSRRNRILLAAGLAAAAVALAVLVAPKFWPAKNATTKQPATAATNVVVDKSIAVLPFVDMSEKKDQEYFADGMAEEVIDLLAKVPSVRVIGRTSSFQFKGKSSDLRTLGSTLGAAYVLEGSVRKSGERLRVTAQLIDAQKGSHVWSESYDELSGDVLKVQDQIAAGIVRALQVTIGADDLRSRPMLKSAEAYDLYLRGRHAFDRLDTAGFDTAVGYFQQALELDPSFVRAVEWLAMTHEALPETGSAPPREGFERARTSVDRALQLNPQSGLMHSLKGLIFAIYDWDWAAAAEECKRALALEPRDPVVLTNVGQVAAALGQSEEATRLFTAALALDPLSTPAHFELGLVRMCTDQPTEAEAEFRDVLNITPTWVSGHIYLGWVLLGEGRLEVARAEMQLGGTGRDAGLATVYYAMGRKAESDAALARYSKERADGDAYIIAVIHAYRAEPDEAFTWLDRAYRQKDPDLYQIKCDPLLKNLRPDPRYKAFLRKMKLPD